MSQTSKMAERLLVHARLCRQIAGASCDEADAEQLEQLADACTRAAARADSDGGPVDQID
jgi:hypothetical protein